MTGEGFVLFYEHGNPFHIFYYKEPKGLNKFKELRIVEFVGEALRVHDSTLHIFGYLHECG